LRQFAPSAHFAFEFALSQEADWPNFSFGAAAIARIFRKNR